MRTLVMAGVAAVLFARSAHAQQPQPAIEFHGLVNVWIAADDSINTFRIRRTELKATGPITAALRWTVQVDPSKVVTLRQERDSAENVRDVAVDLGSVLQDAMLTYRVRDKLFIDVGQFKMPIGREGPQSSSTLETIERGLVVSARNKLSDVRGIGAQGRVTLPYRIQITTGVFNNIVEHLNRVDTNGDKAVIGRVVVGALSSLSVGATGARIVANDSDSEYGSRLGADVLFTTPRATIKAEYLSGEDGRLERRGFYGLAAYKVLPKLEAVVRYDEWDADLDREESLATARERDYVAGLTYFLSGHAAKFQINYLHKTFDAALARSRGQVLVNIQAAW
jgi:hypothetical protein